MGMLFFQMKIMFSEIIGLGCALLDYFTKSPKIKSCIVLCNEKNGVSKNKPKTDCK